MNGNTFVMTAPESIISIPEFDGPWPDSSGEHLLYIERQFIPDKHTTIAKVAVLHIKSNTSHILYDGHQIRTAFWAQGDDKHIAIMESRDHKLTHVLVLRLDSDYALAAVQSVGTVPVEVTGLGAVAAPDGKMILAFSAMATAKGKLHDPEDAPKLWSSGRVYSTMPVRTADSWITLQRLSIFCLVIDDYTAEAARLGGVFNILGESSLEYKPYGGIHLTQHGLALVAGPYQASVADLALATVYYIPMPAILEHNYSGIQDMRAPGLQGYSNCPRISTDGQRLVYLQKPNSWLEDEASHLVICDAIGKEVKFSNYETYQDKTYNALLSPLKVDFADDGPGVYFIAEDRAEVRLFYARVFDTARLTSTPLSQGWSIEGFAMLPGKPTSIFMAGSTINIPRRWVILNTHNRATSLLCQATKESDDAGLEKTIVESIEWLGADGIPVQAWLTKPRDFDATKSYPLLYIIHGGPNAAFNNAWASGAWCNWNFALFSEQGYVVVAPNATGSSGFGQDYGQRVANDWGGKGYIDHVKGFAHIRDHLPFVDTDRAIALGTSYGAYMVNWIQGQPLGRQFKALVAENGFANTKSLYTGELVWFHKDFGGAMFEDSSGYDKFNPINHVDKWSTPTLIIANELDYRVPVLEGLAVFQILQAKGIESRFLSFPDEAHITEKPENRLQWWRVVLEWCAHHTTKNVE